MDAHEARVARYVEAWSEREATPDECRRALFVTDTSAVSPQTLGPTIEAAEVLARIEALLEAWDHHHRPA